MSVLYPVFCFAGSKELSINTHLAEELKLYGFSYRKN